MRRVLVIGGGASGLMAAITAARQGAKVTLIEKNQQPGKKLLTTGNGRCNFTNRRQELSFYRSEDPERVRDEVLKEAARLAAEGIDPALWDRLKNAAYGAMVRHLNSMEDTCMELAEAHFKGEDYLSFPQVFQSIERVDGEALLRSWCVEERMSLSVIAPEE